nr:hypothetical protein [uncultured Campylobacter sp.]
MTVAIFAHSRYQISPQTIPTLAYPTDNPIKSYLKASTSNIPRHKPYQSLKNKTNPPCKNPL